MNNIIKLEKILFNNGIFWFDKKFLTELQIKNLQGYKSLNLIIQDNQILRFEERINEDIIISHNAYVRKYKLKKLI